MGNLFSKSTGRSSSVKPFEKASREEADNKTSPSTKVTMNENHHQSQKGQQSKSNSTTSSPDKSKNDASFESRRDDTNDSDDDTASLGMSHVSKMSLKTPPPGNAAPSRASSRSTTSVRQMLIDSESLECYRRLQAMMKQKGFMSDFPSCDLLRRANEEYRKLDIDWPEDDEGVVCPSPPQCEKSAAISKDRIQELDEHVFSVPDEFMEQPLFDLVQYLVEKTDTEVEEAHVMYRWLTSQPMYSVVIQNGQMALPADYTSVILQKLKRMSLTYADVYAEMVGYTSIECVKITGQMRTCSKDACEPITKSQKHTWCAVYLGRDWRLVDCFLGANLWHQNRTQLEQEKLLDSCSSFLSEVNHFYFIPNPEDLIFSHFPDRDYWQLLPRAVTKSEFQSMPYFQPHFFCLDLRSSQDTLSIQTKDGTCTLELNFAKCSGMRFSYRFRAESKKKKSSRASFNTNVFLENSQKLHAATFLVTLSEKGKYVLEVFGKCSQVHMEHQAHLCSYGISCSQGLKGFKGYPENDRAEWGPGYDVQELGMVAVSHGSGIVEATNGEVEIVFKAPENLTFYQQVIHNGKELPPCAVHRAEKQKVVFTVKPSVSGDSCLRILVKENPADARFSNVCNYLLRCSTPNESVFSVPGIPDGRVGSRKELKKLGLRVVSPRSSLLYSPETGRVDINVQTTKAASLRADLTHYINDVSNDMFGFVSQTVDRNIVTFTVKLPKHGVYNFALFGKRAERAISPYKIATSSKHANDADSGGMVLLHNIMIICNWPYKDCSEFPETLSGWRHGCYVKSPQKKYLPAGCFVKFRIIVPGVDDVAILDGEDWQHLQKGEDELWAGEVIVDEIQAGSSIMVKGSYGGEYLPLLQYQVLSSSDYAALKARRADNVKKARNRVKKLKAEKKWREPDVPSDAITVLDDDVRSLELVDNDTEDTASTVAGSEAGSVSGSSTGTLNDTVETGENGKETTDTDLDTTLTNGDAGATEQKENKPHADLNNSDAPGSNSSGKTSTVEVHREDTSTENTKETGDVADTKTDTEERTMASDTNGKTIEVNERSKESDLKGNQLEVEAAIKASDNREEKIKLQNGGITLTRTESVSSEVSVESHEERLEKKEVSFAVESSADESNRDMDSDVSEDQHSSSFDQWQDKLRDEEKRQEEKTILDFSLPVRLLLKRLRGATKRRDKEDLKHAMADYKDKELDPTTVEFQQARRMLSVLNLRDELVDSLQQNDLDRLKIKIGDADRRGFVGEMRHEISMARSKLKAHEHVRRLHVQMRTTCIDVPTLSEIIRYVKPPELVHHVVQAMLLLMNHHEGKTRRWKKCKKRCVVIGSVKLYRKVHTVQIDDIDPTVAARARQIIEMYAPDEAVMVSPGTGALYGWVQQVVDEVLSYHDDDDEPIKPANTKRQRILFKESEPAPKNLRDQPEERVKSTSIADLKLRYPELFKPKNRRSKTT